MNYGCDLTFPIPGAVTPRRTLGSIFKNRNKKSQRMYYKNSGKKKNSVPATFISTYSEVPKKNQEIPICLVLVSWASEVPVYCVI